MLAIRGSACPSGCSVMTKKYFVSISTDGGEEPHFIAPVRKSGALSFASMETREPVTRFRAVYTGVDLTPSMVFAKMVEAGFAFESVERTLGDLAALLERSRDAKLGDVYEADRSRPDFDFRCLGKL